MLLFINNNMNNILELITYLPDELIREIRQYIPLTTVVFLNKNNYNLYHKCLKKNIIHYENYIRDTVRRDNEFVFIKIIEENYKHWIHIKKYYYKNKIFSNYINFLIDYCIENDSEKCRQTLSNFLKNVGLCQNRHKKNIVQHIRWRK
jgi:hypothetical protein